MVENLKKSQARLVLLEERYQENAETLRTELDKQIKAAEESFAKIKADYEEQKNIINHLLELKQKGEENLKKPGKILIQYGEDYKQNPIKVVEQWYAKKRTELNMQKEQLKELKAEADRTEQELKEKKISQEKGQKELEALNSDHKLQQSIEFMKDKSRDWSAAEEKNLINSRIKELEDQYRYLSKEKAGYSAVENLSLDFILGQVKDCENRLKEFLVDEEEYASYIKNDDLYLVKELKKLENEEQRLREEQEIIQKIVDENRARSFFEEYGKTIIEKKHLSEQLSDLKIEVSLKEEEKNRKKVELEDKLKEHFNQTVMKTVFSKIDPHREMKSIEYTIEFSKEDKPQLYITANDANNNKIRPEWYFSTAQMNTLVFSAFFSRALNSDLELKTIFIDDPIAHFDDMNILGFADLIRCLIMETPFQFIMSTHDRKIYEIMKRKLPSDLYRAKYIEL